MIFRQILHPATGCASYIFGCTGKKALAVVDAHVAHLDDYLTVAEASPRPSSPSSRRMCRPITSRAPKR
ncbi:MAG: hypothetical protein ACXWP6_17730 [Ktedonobacterales bacterium]